MCQIQIVKRFDNKNLTKKDIKGFCNLMYYGNLRNNDAWGIHTENGLILKTNKKMCIDELYSSLKGIKTNLLVGHNRWKTKGSAEKMENNHPFDTDNFLVVHNGVLRNDETLKSKFNLNYTVETDSYIISALLEKFYAETGNDYEAVKKTAEQLIGTFSVSVFCKTTKRMFYFKEKNTDFCFGLIKTPTGDILVGSTDKDNIPLSFSTTVRGIFSIPAEHVLVEPDAYTIYEIKHDEIVEIETFTQATDWKYQFNYDNFKTSFKSKSINTSTPGLRSTFKNIADDISDFLVAEHGLEVINRKYDFANNELILTVKNYVGDKVKTSIENQYVTIGDINFEEIIIGTKVYKTNIIISLDGDYLNDFIIAY